VGDRSSTLIEDTRPLLESQAQTTDALRLWAQSLAGITGQVVTNDPQVRTLLQDGPDAADEVARLFEQIKPTLPILLANMTTFGQVAVTYHASLEQVLVLLPPFVANILASAPENNPTGIPLGDFRISVEDPPPCTVGFLPPSQWRSPADTTTIDTPDGLYCKLPQDSPIVVRGARNSPCMGVPGKRAPTVQECYSDQPYRPLAMRQHALGPRPIDPNLIAQGVPPDDRVDFNDRIFAPIEGTPPPPDAAPPPPDAVPPPVPVGPPGPTDSLAPPDVGGDVVPAAPSAFTGDSSSPGLSVATAHYDPQTGRYATPDGKVYEQTDLVDPPKTWQDLIFKADE
jgi:phospholipid/cholesterol/gamma-HCH transport system substrate-binding protein